jgi:sulfatase maturation enzyme AslB (radical SAM superfamily)
MDLPVTTRTLTLRRIKVLHLEPTDVCQLACPLCARETDAEFNKRLQHHLTIPHIQHHFSDRVIKGLDKVFMCGNYGDPAAGKYTLDIYRWFRNLNPNITLGMNTNGALQTTFYWHELGRLFNQPQDYVVFSIDGLEDTNPVYRVNSNWSKLMANVESYISAGGAAHWDMLVYKHNQHQVDACEQLARDMGFSWFRAKVSKRPLTQRLEAPMGWTQPISNLGKIKCHALQEKSAYIDARGRLGPCCWLGVAQTNFVVDFDKVKKSWTSTTPNLTCQQTCSVDKNKTTFENQWQRETQLR